MLKLKCKKTSYHTVFVLHELRVIGKQRDKACSEGILGIEVVCAIEVVCTLYIYK